ncbi:MAG: FAD:protein FMN transferase, partial [Nitrospirae bacterium]
ALATACFVLGPERGLAFLARAGVARAIVVDAAGRRHDLPAAAAGPGP